MSDFSAPYPPPPAFPYGQGPARPSNGRAVTALVLGISALVLSPVPLVNLVAVLLALPGIAFGVAGINRGRRIRRGTAMASWGLGLSVVALVVSAVVSFFAYRYAGDLLDFVEPPEPSAEIGEEFRTDDGDLTVTVTSVTCGVSDAESPESADATVDTDRCTFAFDARNSGDRVLYLDHIKVKAVVDGDWEDLRLDGDTTLEVGASGTITGTIGVYGSTLEGLAFDADDASSHSAVVVDVSSASD